MEFFQDLLSNQIFISAVLAWLVAQLLKTIIHTIINKDLVMERMVGSGGMPSSHSATVCALSVSSAITCGVESPEFAIAAIFAIVVMYDAMGVRRETGKQSKIINEMLDIFTNMGNTMTPEDRLREFIGHSPLQVVVGAVLGIIVGFAVCSLI